MCHGGEVTEGLMLGFEGEDDACFGRSFCHGRDIASTPKLSKGVDKRSEGPVSHGAVMVGKGGSNC